MRKIQRIVTNNLHVNHTALHNNLPTTYKVGNTDPVSSNSVVTQHNE